VGIFVHNIAPHRAFLFMALATAAPTAASAQTTTNTSSPPPNTVTVPDLQHFSLPPGANTQLRTPPPPEPTPTPTQAPTATPAAPLQPPPVARTLPAPGALPHPRAHNTSGPAEPAPRPTPTPTATPSPTPLPSPSATAILPPQGQTVAPTVASSPPVIAPPPRNITRHLLGWSALAAALLIVFAAFLIPVLLRRRRAARREAPWLEPLEPDDAGGALTGEPDPGAREPEAAATPLPPEAEPAMFRPSAAAPVPPIAAEPALEIHFAARRAGLTLTGAAIDYALELRNAGTRPLSDIRVDIRMLTASETQDQVIAATFAAPIERPVVIPFALPGGMKVDLGGMATLPAGVLVILTMQERRFFVPMIAIRAVYRDEEGREGEVTSVRVVGIDRGPEAKMAPFHVDVPPRMYDNVTQRVHVTRR
jgi:hypothetical protein